MRLKITLGGLALATFAAPAIARPGDIVDTAVAAGNFGTLATALEAADLLDALRGDGPFTVFAPTDAAFAALPHGTVETLLRAQNKQQLQSVLTYHVVAGELRAQEVLARPSVTTLNGQRPAISVSDAGARIGGATITVTDIACDNGVIHVIDAVLIPESTDLVGIAQSAGSFGTLLAAAEAAGLVDALRTKELTVLAPTDEAFAKLGSHAIEDLLKPANRGRLADILKYHVIPGRVYADGAIEATSAVTLQGSPLGFRLENGQLLAGKARVLNNDIQASNGVIHVIDSVLLPPSGPKPTPKGQRLVIGYYGEQPSAALASQLGIDRSTSLLVTSVNRNGTGLEQYDVILTVGGRPYSKANVEQAKREAGFEGTVAFRLLRGGKHYQLEAPVSAEKH